MLRRKRAILMLTVVGSILDSDDTTNKLHSNLLKLIHHNIMMYYKQDKTLLKAVREVSTTVWDKILHEFQGKPIEPSLFLSFTVDCDEEMFRRLGITEDVVADYYKPLYADNALEIERNTRLIVKAFWTQITKLTRS